MAAPPVRFDIIVELIVDVMDAIYVEEDRAYQKVISQVMVDEGLGSPVPHKYEAWNLWTEGSLFGPLHEFNGLFGGANGLALENAANGA
ncbi:hypothetical protein NL676_029794 [Syzygium grande]|nr:hypothetical protein NL676_029794 [Syzygium grande]